MRCERVGGKPCKQLVLSSAHTKPCTCIAQLARPCDNDEVSHTKQSMPLGRVHAYERASMHMHSKLLRKLATQSGRERFAVLQLPAGESEQRAPTDGAALE